jgi:histidine kinase
VSSDSPETMMPSEAYDIQAILEEASQSLASLLDLDEIIRCLLDLSQQAMPVRSGTILLINHDDTLYHPCASFGEGALPSLPIHHPLVMAVLEDPEIHARTVLPIKRAHRICETLAEIDAELLIPLSFNRRVHGLLVLGAKCSGEAYTDCDLGLLKTLASQSAIAIENANAYRTIQRLNHELEAEVKSRTSELYSAYRNLQDTQAQLVHSEKMSSLGRLVAGVAHELNNPITFVYSGVGILQGHIAQIRRLLAAYDAEAPPEAIAALKAEIGHEKLFRELDFLIHAFQEGATRVKDIVQNLRNFSRADEYAMRQVNLHEGLRSTVALVNANFKHRVAIHLELGDVPEILGSAGHLNQVFMNLLVNACQSIEGHGDVWVSLYEAPEGGVVEIRDNGCGISPEVREKIFEPFFTTKPLGEGTGLGLSICHGIIEKHEGRIEVESAPGAGTTFRIVFPLVRGA